MGEKKTILCGASEHTSARHCAQAIENILEKSCSEDASDMSDEDFPVRRNKRFAGQKGVKRRKNQLKANQAGKGKIHPENVFPLRTYRD